MTAPRWSRTISGDDNTLTLDKSIFALSDPTKIARLLKDSAEQSRRRRSTPFRSAMSVLTFHINRAGAAMPEAQRTILEAAKVELRRAFGKT